MPGDRAARSPRHPQRLSILCMLLLLTLAGTIAAHAQTYDPRTGGRTYVLAFPDTTRNTYDGRQDTDPRFTPREPRQDSMFISIYSPTANDVVITGAGGYSKAIKMESGGFEVVFLNGRPRSPTPIVTESGIISDKTFRLEATRPVIVYCFMVTKFGAEAWTPAPVESWGTDYYAAALPGEVLYDEFPGAEIDFVKRPLAGPSEILIVAAFDDTRITIVPNGRLESNPPTIVLLQRNQCYQVQSFVDTNSLTPGIPQPDLGGSHIYASRPIGVISGNTRAQVLNQAGGVTKNSFKNLMIEWLSPVEQHGREFVYLPTWDAQMPTGTPGENPDWKRQGEVVRVYATAGQRNETPPTVTSGKMIDGLTGSTARSFSIDRSDFFETLVTGTQPPAPQVFKTDRPAQAFMSSTAVVKLNGASGGGSFVGVSYSGWAPYMVQMVPREQWSWVAPYYAPVHPPKMTHYLNVVTDSASRNKIKVGGSLMVINRKIAGTDLYWGTKTLNRGDKGLVQGADTSAKFYAFVYGGIQGFEAFRPSNEYEENIGLMYGYPLAAGRTVLVPGDSLWIDTMTNCGALTVTIRTVNAGPAGLRAIALDSGENARLTFVSPAPPEPLIGVTQAQVKLSPIDAHKDASGVLLIQDRTGKEWRVPYSYQGEFVNTSPGLILDFGEVMLNSTPTMNVTITNPTSHPLRLDALYLELGDQSFSIVSTKPAISDDPRNPTMIPPGSSLVVTIESHPTLQNKVYGDSLKATLGCIEVALPIRAETVQPCLGLGDLEFGILEPGQQMSLPLTLCNYGRGEVAFSDPWLTWLQSEFFVPATEIDKLKNARLGYNDCVEITVRFVAGEPGTYEEAARVWSNTAPGCRDISVWRAVVSDRSGVGEAADEVSGEAGGYRLERIEPNPASSEVSIGFTLGEPGLTSVAIHDADGHLAASLLNGHLDAGGRVISWRPDGFPSGIYYCRITSGSWRLTRPILLVR